MKIQHLEKNNFQNFKGYKPDPKIAGNFLFKKSKWEMVDRFSFITAATSMTGFAVGGYGLLKDYFYDLNHCKKGVKTTQNLVCGQFKNFDTAGKISSEFTNTPQCKKSDGGARTIVPSTKAAKIALVFAKVGIAFSGIAGIFNGISMGLPLMSFGETLNLAASPIIETPIGTGLFGIALAAVFSGRALEHDPMLKLDKVKLSQQKGLFKKAVYVLENVKNCAKEVLDTAKIFGKNIFGLFSKNSRNNSLNFFKDSVFSISPKKIVLQEFINKDGSVIVKKAFKNNPYLMHASSLVLVTGGVLLTLCSLLKNKFGQKVGLTTYETGGSLDNLSLSRAGMEKFVMANNPSDRLAGALQGLSGLGILAGQPGVDTKWGRGTQWLGTALLFGVFTVERTANAFKPLLKSAPELTTLIRQWEIDLTKLYSNSELNKKLTSKNSLLNSIIKYVKFDGINNLKGKEKAQIDLIKEKIENTEFKKIFDTAQKILTQKGEYLKDSAALEESIRAEILKSYPDLSDSVSEIFKKMTSEGDYNYLKKMLEDESEQTFQKI